MSDHGYETAEHRDIQRAQTIKELRATGVPWEYGTSGTVVLFDKFILTLRTNKWRVKGKNKWYRYKNVQDLLDRYILPQVDHKQENKNEH